MPRAGLALLAVLIAVAAGCGGGSGGSSTAGTTTAAAHPAPAPATGKVLSQFIEAAARGDAATMWSLLSKQSQQTLGPTQSDFASKRAAKFRAGLGAFSGNPYKIVLAVQMPSGWGVAAVGGDRTRQGKPEFATYAAALRQEGGAWKLELGDPVDVIVVDPKSASVSDTRPAIGIEFKAKAPIEEAGLWLDGQALAGGVSGTDPKDVIVTGRPSAPLIQGRHFVIAFGRADGVATAGSVPFTVQSSSA